MTTREAPHAAEPGVVEQLAAWVLAMQARDLSQAAILQAKLLLLDTIGCGFAALDEQSARALLAVVETSGGAPQCTVIGRARRTSAPNAVLANGALVRILDFNDYVNAKGGDLGGHPSDNVPVALAAGELAGACGREVVAAVVLGYEIFGRCKELMERDSAWDGVTVSGLAAPAMAGRLMGLDRGRLAHAIALSAASPRPRPRCASATFPPPSPSPTRSWPKTACKQRYWRSAASPGRSICSRTRAGCARFFARATQRRP